LGGHSEGIVKANVWLKDGEADGGFIEDRNVIESSPDGVDFFGD
jgi:hypothetical protein